MSVSAVVVTFNRLKLLKECLSGLLRQSYKLDNIFVINNDSSDGTKEYLNNLNNPIIKPINNKRNLGGAGGFSLGIQMAFERSNSDLFWIMDDDTIPMKNSLYKLSKVADKLDDKFGFLCSNVKWWKDYSTSIMNIPKPAKDWMEYLTHGLVQVISASFVSLLIPRNSVKKVGCPISEMFIWGDDIEYTTRLSRIYKSFLVPNSIVLHKSATNAENISNFKSSNNKNVENVFNVPLKRLFYYKCKYRNSLYTSRKYYKYPKTVELLLEDIFILIRTPFLSYNHRFRRFWCVLSGICNGFFFNPRIKFPKL